MFRKKTVTIAAVDVQLESASDAPSSPAVIEPHNVWVNADESTKTGMRQSHSTSERSEMGASIEDSPPHDLVSGTSHHGSITVNLAEQQARSAIKIQALFRGHRARATQQSEKSKRADRRKEISRLTKMKTQSLRIAKANNLGDNVIELLEEDIKTPPRSAPLRTLAEGKAAMGTPDAERGWIRYGALRFPGSVASVPSKWAAVAKGSNVQEVRKLLTDTWSLQPPKVIFSVTGGAMADIPELTARQREVFVKGLSNVMSLTDAWALTGGMNSGVMKLVGQTVSDTSITGRNRVCLGIATWGVVKNHEDLCAHLPIYHVAACTQAATLP